MSRNTHLQTMSMTTSNNITGVPNPKEHIDPRRAYVYQLGFRRVRSCVADPETGGISINEALKFIRGLRGINTAGADIVCFVRHLDATRITA